MDKTDPVHEFAQNYEFRADDGDYTPAAHERAMIEDAIHGYLGSALDSDCLQKADALWAALQHGDDDHRAWLLDACRAHFTGRPIPKPRGGGIPATPAPDSEKLREALASLLDETRSYLADAPVGHAVHEAIERADRILMAPGASS